jgi:hypothetical protein
MNANREALLEFIFNSAQTLAFLLDGLEITEEIDLEMRRAAEQRLVPAPARRNAIGAGVAPLGSDYCTQFFFWCPRSIIFFTTLLRFLVTGSFFFFLYVAYLSCAVTDPPKLLPDVKTEEEVQALCEHRAQFAKEQYQKAIESYTFMMNQLLAAQVYFLEGRGR